MNNGYYSAIGKIGLTDSQKSETVYAAMNTTKKPKNIRLIMRVCCCSIALIIIGISAMWIINSGIGRRTTKALAPHLKVNDIEYWYCGGGGGDGISYYDVLPDRYELIGEIKGYGSDNYEASFGDIGDKIYALPDNPYSVLVEYGDDGGYKLFVCRNLNLSQIVMYNGRLFGTRNFHNSLIREDNLNFDGYTEVGKIKKVAFDEYPDEDFQSNISFTLGSEVYAKEGSDTIYVKYIDGDVYYIELKYGDYWW